MFIIRDDFKRIFERYLDFQDSGKFFTNNLHSSKCIIGCVMLPAIKIINDVRFAF